MAVTSAQTQQQAGTRSAAARQTRRHVLRLVLAFPTVSLLAACGASGSAGTAARATGSAGQVVQGAGQPAANPPAAAVFTVIGQASTSATTTATATEAPATTTILASASEHASAATAVAPGSTTTHANPTTAASASTQATTAPSCILAPEETEGPYYIDEKLVRSDITEGQPGMQLVLKLTIVNASSCQALPGAVVDIWHCDAGGNYSGYGSSAAQPGPSTNQPPPGDAHVTPTNKLTYLRGSQTSDAAGFVTFKTIYPGWYTGRTTHIHVKVHAGGNVVHTGQLYFDGDITISVYQAQPYAKHGPADTSNKADSIYGQGGAQSMLALAKAGSGLTGAITLGVKV